MLLLCGKIKSFNIKLLEMKTDWRKSITMTNNFNFYASTPHTGIASQPTHLHACKMSFCAVVDLGF